MTRLKIKKPQGHCVFCGRPGLSKEHVWPEWTHEYLSRDAEPVNVRASFAVDASAPTALLEQRRRKQGDVHTLQVRVVCREHCNGGWMSRLEMAAAPILIPLIKGDALYLGPHEQKVLASWITKTSMMFEFADHKRISSSQGHRRFLMQSGEPPVGWKIWIANYRGEEWRSKAFRSSTALTTAGIDVRVVDKKKQPAMNTQSITFGVGKLLAQVISTTVPSVIFDVDPKFEPYTPQIWPFKSALNWPPVHVLNDADAKILTSGLARMIRNDPNYVLPS
jgi:hypothetical protein